jgi:RNA polymerase sigma-70 factor (ECF subfamily)
MANQRRFMELYLAHEDGLRSFVRALVRTRTDFDDVFQTVVLTLWERFDTYDETRPFGPWARGVAAREVFQARRDSGRRPTPFSPKVVEAILDSFDRHASSQAPVSQRLEALERCLEALPGRARRLLSLRYFDGLSLAEMALRVGSTLGATQRSLSRARQQLAECVRQRLLVLARSTP